MNKLLIVSHGALIKTTHFNLVEYNEDANFLLFNPKNVVVYGYEINND